MNRFYRNLDGREPRAAGCERSSQGYGRHRRRPRQRAQFEGVGRVEELTDQDREPALTSEVAEQALFGDQEPAGCAGGDEQADYIRARFEKSLC